MARVICAFAVSTLTWARLGRHNAECEPVEVGVRATSAISLCSAIAVRTTSAEGRTPKQGVNYQFSDAGIHVESSASKTDLSWAAIRRVSEMRSAFLVFTNPSIAFTLPKGCFESTQCVASLRELFRAHVPKTKLRHD